MTEPVRCGRATKKGTPCRVALFAGRCLVHDADLSARNKAVRAAYAQNDPDGFKAHQARGGTLTAREQHGRWQGDNVSKAGGRKRAQRWYRGNTCGRCGAIPDDSKKLHRHHKDRDTSNNAPGNIELLCEGCHVAEHNGSYYWFAEALAQAHVPDASVNDGFVWST